jgi:hypothetical protein
VTDKIRPAGKMPTKPIGCQTLIEVLEEKLKTHKKGVIRKWIRCRLKQLSK